MTTLFVIIGLLIGGNVFGQNNSKVFTEPITNGKLNYIVGLKNTNTVELGLARGTRNWGFSLVNSNYHISPEITITPNNSIIIGTKLGFSATYFILNMGTQLIHYTDFQKQDFAIRPEIGPSFFGILDLVYGYNIYVTKKEINSISNHCISLRVTFGGENSQYIKWLLGFSASNIK